ncbi:PREDICTED: myotubularin-related protein 11, partial [Cyprinodon variegatus]|uniref:myotubularin-related protein 11 n=1 Tax=Cyprinodon variegatus TaxID=28743 RepID=UPI00074284CD
PSPVCLLGECVLQRTAMVRKKLTAREGRGWLSGTLFCTHFRVAFVPQDGPKADDNADPILLGDHDIALASIEKVVAVGPNRTKLVTPNSSLKFTPEELVLYCRDMRVMCFLFDRLTPDAQVIEITFTIAKTYQPLRPGSVLSFQNAALGSVEMKQFLSNRRRDSHMNWFESAADWEQELERCGATSWRVSSVNDRFEMSNSLSKYIVVPHKVLDTELKKSFAHFNEGRIPRWCWRHPRGSDLLRMSSFQNNIYHEKDDLRNLELVLFGCQSSLCVVVELGDELPSPADIQLAHSRLRALCLGGGTRTNSPVFLLFLDCVWHLWFQFPSRFQLTDDFLLALHDSVHLPLFSTFLSNCQRERCKRSQNVSQSYTPVNGWRDMLSPHSSSDPLDPPLPPVWDWALQYSQERRDRFSQSVVAPPPLQPLLNGNLNTNLDAHRLADTIPGSVFLLSRGTFTSPPNLPPWRSGSSAVYKKSHRRALSSENVPGLERLLKAWSLADVPQNPAAVSGPKGALDPCEPLLPLLMGPCMGLWRECYLRGALHAQAFSHPVSSNRRHPVDRLAEEVQQLKDQLAQLSSSKRPDPLASTQEPRRTDGNLNQSTNNSTFLYSALRPKTTPPPTSTKQHSSRGHSSSSSSAPLPSRPPNRDGNKHSFLFGHSAGADPRSEPRYHPPPGTTKLPKSNGPPLTS